jgi:hypothetical protein
MVDASRKRIDACLISDQGELIDRFTATPDRDGLHGLARRVAAYGEPVRGVVESMNGARFVHEILTYREVLGRVPQPAPERGVTPRASPRQIGRGQRWRGGAAIRLRVAVSPRPSSESSRGP